MMAEECQLKRRKKRCIRGHVNASYKIIGIRPLTKTVVIIQLSDKYLVHPKGVLDEVLVQVNELIFLADFYVLDMGN